MEGMNWMRNVARMGQKENAYVSQEKEGKRLHENHKGR
jgi:hypothetical protein